jgi:hypothetical protein
MLKTKPKNEHAFQKPILKTLLKRRSKGKRRRMPTSGKKMKWLTSLWMKKNLMRTESL